MGSRSPDNDQIDRRIPENLVRNARPAAADKLGGGPLNHKAEPSQLPTGVACDAPTDGMSHMAQGREAARRRRQASPAHGFVDSADEPSRVPRVGAIRSQRAGRNRTSRAP